MKSFKEYLQEDHSGHGYGFQGAGLSSSKVPYDIEDQEVKNKVNAILGHCDVSEFLNPKAAVEQLASKLRTLGLEMKIPEMSGNGSVNLEVTQFGGRFGKDIDGSDIKDDGISHKKEGGLKLNVKYETLQNGSSKVFAKLV